MQKISIERFFSDKKSHHVLGLPFSVMACSVHNLFRAMSTTCPRILMSSSCSVNSCRVDIVSILPITTTRGVDDIALLES